MSENKKQSFLEKIDKAPIELKEIWQQTHETHKWIRFQDRYERWKNRWGDWIRRNISQDESVRFLAIEEEEQEGLFFTPWAKQKHINKRFEDYFEGLRDDAGKYVGNDSRSPGEQFFDLQSEKTPLSGKQVFIVHGHDGTSLGQLSDLLKDEFGLEPIILKKKAGRSRHILLKFEQEAKKAAFALVLLTPDDIVKTEKGEFAQARPNAIFELGWFFAQLGRERVRIIMRKGMQIHSDLDGVERLEFHEDIDEILIKLRRELEAGGYDPGKKEFVA
ncbi:MAG: nucleotide-binding protein [Proteobacteria bacterium]|nr:nucleotide-binding protein [Pseudomonadota bacterium]